MIETFLYVGEKQVLSASPAFDLHGSKGEAEKRLLRPYES